MTFRQNGAHRGVLTFAQENPRIAPVSIQGRSKRPYYQSTIHTTGIGRHSPKWHSINLGIASNLKALFATRHLLARGLEYLPLSGCQTVDSLR